MGRFAVVSGLAFAGVFVLAGAGWALLTGAVLVLVLFRGEPDWAVIGRRASEGYRLTAHAVRAAPKRVVAVTGMAGGLALVPAGLILSAGAGAGIAVAGGLLIGLSLLTGQGA